MNIKERILAAINHKKVDKIPTGYRGIDYVSQSLLKHFGFKDFNIKKYRKFLDCLGADVWSSGQCPGAFSYFIPETKYPDPEDPWVKEGDYFYTLGIKARLKLIEKYNYNTIVWWDEPPLADIDSYRQLQKGFLTSKLDNYRFDKFINKNIANEDFRDKKIDPDLFDYNSFIDSSDDLICMGTLNQPFMICIYLRGMENFLMDLVSNKKLAEGIISEVSDFCIEFNRRELEGFGYKAELYSMWDDVADQNGLMFNPELFKKYFLPIYKEFINNSKKYDLIFSWHCCGNVNAILPYMIEAGIDIFDVVQTSAKDMEIENIYKLYEKDICLHGGIDVQKLLVSGKPIDVENEVKKIIELWGDNGGIILAPSHEAVPDTPIENIIAIYKTVNDLMN